MARGRPRRGLRGRAQAARLGRSARCAPVRRHRLEHRRRGDGRRRAAIPSGRSRSASPSRATTSARTPARSPSATGRCTRSSSSSPMRRRSCRASPMPTTSRSATPRRSRRTSSASTRAGSSPSHSSATAETRSSPATSAIGPTRSRSGSTGFPAGVASLAASGDPAPPLGPHRAPLGAVPGGPLPRHRGARRDRALRQADADLPAGAPRAPLDRGRAPRARPPRDAPAQLLGPARAAGISGLQLTDVDTYLPDDLLFKADIASMANSLELRAPLLDHQLAELALGLPTHLRLEGSTGKVALRRAFAADLPPEILDARQGRIRRAGRALVPRGPARPRRRRAPRRDGARARPVPARGGRAAPRRARERLGRPRRAHLDARDARALAARVRRRGAETAPTPPSQR